MPEEKKDKQDRMIEILGETLKWIKVTSIPQVKKLLLEILPGDKEKIAYHYSDGRDSRAVAKLAGMHFTTVAIWWKRWERAGIAESIGAKRGERARRAFSLEDFGIEVPLPKKVGPLEKQAEAPPQEAPIEKSSEVNVAEGMPTDNDKTEESV